MKKIILFLTIISLNSMAYAEKHDLCRRWYSHDIFQTYLRLYVDTKESLIFMDRHIPYGIRPFGYQISKLSCTKDKTSLMISSKTDFGDEFIFNFHQVGDSPTQSGTVTYMDQGGLPASSQAWECSLEAVKSLCLEL